MTNLSVVVITRNRLNKLRRCLDSIKGSLPGAEIVAVDNGSSDGTVEYLKNCQGIKIRLLNENRGVAGARNLGVSMTTKDFVMWLDDDAWIQVLDFSLVEKHFANNSSVGIIAPRLLYPDGRIQESVRSFPTLLALFWRGSNLFRLFPKVYWYTDYILDGIVDFQKIDWSIGACQIIRKSVFDKVGKLDESYFFGYEDADFCLRAEKKDYLTFFWPDAIIYHEYARESSRGISIAFFRHIYSILRFFFKKWYGKICK